MRTMTREQATRKLAFIENECRKVREELANPSSDPLADCSRYAPLVREETFRTVEELSGAYVSSNPQR